MKCISLKKCLKVFDKITSRVIIDTWDCGGIGRHTRLKICCLYKRGGSSPPNPTF